MSKHSKSKSSAHYASFDVRVDSVMERMLMVSGAALSCTSLAFATRLGLFVDSNPHENLRCRWNSFCNWNCKRKVKIGKRQDVQHFLVVKEAIAGYHILFGQDYMAKNYVSLGFSPTSVRIEIGTGSDTVVMKRALIETSLKTNVCLVTPTVPISEPDEPSCNCLRRDFNKM